MMRSIDPLYASNSRICLGGKLLLSQARTTVGFQMHRPTKIILRELYDIHALSRRRQIDQDVSVRARTAPVD
jgi:hypothetical protein